MSSRNTIQQLIDSKIFDNNNKEILASMVREVLEEMMNSDFNKTDDQLQNLKYNSTLTLAQKFNQTPQILRCVIGTFDIGQGTGSIPSAGEVTITASLSDLGGGCSKIFATFPTLNIFEKDFIISAYTDNPGDDILRNNSRINGITYRRDTTNQLSIILRETLGVTQNLFLRILIV